MNILQFIIPPLLFGFFIYKARKSPIYACGVPLIYCFKEAAFIKTAYVGFKVPHLPVTLGREDIVFLLLVGAWWYVRQKRTEFKEISFKSDTFLLVILLFLFVIQVPFKWIMGDPVYGSTLIHMSRYCYIVFSVVLWMDILRRFTREEVWQLVRAISIVTALLMIFYIISSVGIKVYPFEAYRTYFEGSVTIVRDYNTFPFWTGLALAYFIVALASDQKRLGAFLFLPVIVIGTILRITRSNVMAMGMMFGVAILYYTFFEKAFKKLCGFVALGVAGASFVLITIYAFFMPNMEALLMRFGETQKFGFYNIPNLQGRANIFLETLHYVMEIDPIFGFGIYTGPGSSFIQIFPSHVIDTMWHKLLINTGISGIICIGLFLAVIFMYSVHLCFNHEPERRRMGIFLVLAMIWEGSLSFIGQSYLVFKAGSVFPLALAAVEARNLWAISPVTVKSIPRIIVIELDWFARSAVHKLAGFLILIYMAYKIGGWI